MRTLLGSQGHRPKAIVLDLDGTLYRQRPLQRTMLLRLLAACAANPVEGWRILRALRAYRRAQEELRGDSSGDVAAAQIRRASEQSNVDRESVAAYVERWMEREPLAFLARFIQPGLIEFLQASRANRMRLGVLSDYPVDAKLRALGVAEFFDVALCAQAPEIGVFKPSPRGLRVALERLGVSPLESVYVGDRAEVDAAAAEAAGVPCVILSASRAASTPSYVAVRSYAELQALLFGGKQTSV